MKSWVCLFLAIFTEIAASSRLKQTAGFSKLLPSLLVILGYGVSFVFLSLAIDAIPLGIAYALWSGVGIISISAIDYFLYKQTLDLPAVLGICLICGGVVVMNLFSKSLTH